MTTRSPDRRVFVSALGALPWSLAARASAPTDGLSLDQAATVARARSYLQGLKSAKGRFVQTDPRGAISGGAFYLQRPGKARFEYDSPSGLVIASNGFRVAVVNTRLKTIQAYPLGMTPLGLLLSKDIRIDRGVVVGKVVSIPTASPSSPGTEQSAPRVRSPSISPIPRSPSRAGPLRTRKGAQHR
jgi:outer membrane lipoprotein-sorting protein